MSGVRVACERAVRFVESHGDAEDRARAAALHSGESSDALVAQLAFEATPVAAARRTLGICDELSALSGASVETLVAELAATQAADGGWAEGADLEERLFETGMIAGYLAKTRYARPQLLDAAGDFLARHFSPDRVQGGALDAITAFAHYFANALHEESDAVLQWCGRELERGFRTRAFDAVATARVLVCCDAHGLPGAQLGPEELVLALVTEQRPDGSFPGRDGDASLEAVVEATLHGLVSLRRLGS